MGLESHFHLKLHLWHFLTLGNLTIQSSSFYFLEFNVHLLL